jgi:hypothetical protein
MRLAMPRIFETRADGVFLVLAVLGLVLIVVARDGIDLSRIPFTGWMHP